MWRQGLKMNSFVTVFATHLRQCVILSTIYWISQCVADKKLDISGKENEPDPNVPPHLIPIGKDSVLSRFWIIILGVLGGIIVTIVCFCCYFFVLQRRQFFQRKPVSNPPAASRDPPAASASSMLGERHSWNRASRRSEAPPDYTSVVLGVHRFRSVPEHPQLERVETPPPAYITVVPFQ